MRPPAPPPSGFLHRRGHAPAMGAGFVEICRRQVDQALSRIPAAAYVPGAPPAHAAAAFAALFSRIPDAAVNPVAPYVPASAAPPLPHPRRGRKNRKRKRRRHGDAAAPRDPGLALAAPAPVTPYLGAATLCPDSASAAAAAAAPVSRVPAAPPASADPLWHAPATRPTPLYRVPAVPGASDASPFPTSRVPAAPHTPAAPPASASPSAPHFSPPRELSKRATGSAFSAPRKFSQRPAAGAEESGRQIVVGAVRPPELTACPMPPPRPSSSCPPRPMPPPPSPLSHTPAEPRASASPAADHCSPKKELSQRAAASRCGHSPPRELSQRPAAAVATEESEIVGAVSPAGADRVTSVPPRDARMASEAHVKSLPPREATVGQEEESKSAEELKRELEQKMKRPALRSRHRKKIYHEEVVQRAKALKSENSSLRAELEQIKMEHGGLHSKNASLERELEHVSKEMNDLRNECAELKKCMKNKDLEIEAKEAETQTFKKAKLGCSSKDSSRMDIDRSFHTPANKALLAEASCWTSTSREEKLDGKNKELCSSQDGTSSPGGYLEENAHLELKSNKCKDIKAEGVQTDIKAALDFSIRDVTAYYTYPSTTTTTTTCAPPLPYVHAPPHASAAFTASISHIPSAATPVTAYVPGAPHAYGAFAAPHFRIAAAATPVPRKGRAFAAFAHHCYIPAAAAASVAAYYTSPSITCAPPLPYVPAVAHASAAFAAPPLPRPP